MGFHYKYNASGAHRWLKCRAFKALETKVPERPTSAAARTGTAAHYLAEWAFNNGYGLQVDEKLIGARIRVNPDEDAFQIVTGPGCEMGASYAGIQWADDATKTAPEYPHVIPVDERMVKAVAIYTNTVHAILQKYPSSSRHVELGFELEKDMGGMGDMVILAPRRIIVLDYKNGTGFVDAKDNPQLAMYGVGALSKFAARHEVNDVVMGIVQPNAGGSPVRTWTQTVDQMRGWRDRFEAARYECEKVEEEMNQGRDISQHCTTGTHCKWCPAMVVCPALQQKTRELAQRLPDVNQPNQLPAPATLTDERLMWVAEHGDAIIEFVEQCRAHMTDMAAKGKQWPGYKLAEKQTKRHFAVDKKLLAQKFKEAGHMQAFEPKLKGIGALEKIFGAEAIAPFVEKPAGALELVPNYDPRPAHNKSILAQLPELGEKK